MKLKDMAKQVKMISVLTENRDKMPTKDVIGQPISVNAIDIVNDGRHDYLVFTCVEYPDNFMFGGTVITEMFTNMVNKFFAGDITGFNEELQKDPLKIKLVEVRSKNVNASGLHNTYTNVEILD